MAVQRTVAQGMAVQNNRRCTLQSSENIHRRVKFVKFVKFVKSALLAPHKTALYIAKRKK